MKHLLEKKPQKEDSTRSILDLEGELSRKYLSAHFYDEIKSVLAENCSLEIKPPYFLSISEYFLNIF